ncbi:hypothetical protein F1880_002346 [Penicillium rolfsii]|nr:hypothetical protein F1880_002346 [Penicillium rolfsii]
MVKFNLIPVTVMATSLAVALASNCQYSLNYCGYNLLNRGNYYNDIYNELKRSGQPTDAAHIENSLFYCAGGIDVGAITFVTFCGNSCHNGGNDRTDSC